MTGNKGDLVYIPASATLIKKRSSDEAVVAYAHPDKPINVLCIGEAGGYKKIIYKSEVWLVSKEHVYLAKRS